MNEFIYANTEIALNCLINNSLRAQEYLSQEERHIIKNQDYVRDFCFIHMKGTRRSGNTEALKRVARNFENPLFILPLQDMLHNYTDVRNKISISLLLRYRGRPCDAIFVDQYSLLCQAHKQELESFCVPYLALNGRFILVGMQ